MNYKGYLITNDRVFPTLYTVATEGRGGKIPAILEGRFTAVSYVRELIDKYTESQEAARVRKAATKE